MRACLAAVLAFTAAACGETQAPEPEPAPEFLDLLCVRFANVSAEALARAYGDQNLAEEALPGPEGENYQATVLFPNDPERRLEIVWRDAQTRTNPASISVPGAEGASAWTGNNGLAIGQSIERVEALNGGRFRLWGFGWDYGGWVSEWNGGLFAPADGCMTRVRFQARAGGSALGDSEFGSADPAMRAADPVVAEFGLSFATR